MMERVAGGDMTVSFQARSRDELGELDNRSTNRWRRSTT